VGEHRFPFPQRPLIENGCFSSIWEDAKSEVQVHRARQDDFFQIAAFADQIIDRITMTDRTMSCSMIDRRPIAP